jgi:hypothetical protein
MASIVGHKMWSRGDEGGSGDDPKSGDHQVIGWVDVEQLAVGAACARAGAAVDVADPPLRSIGPAGKCLEARSCEHVLVSAADDRINDFGREHLSVIESASIANQLAESGEVTQRRDRSCLGAGGVDHVEPVVLGTDVLPDEF